LPRAAALLLGGILLSHHPLQALAAPPARYGREPAIEPTPLERAAIEETNKRLLRGGSRPHTSASLIAAARELARRAADGDKNPLARSRLRTALARALAFDPGPAAHIARTSPPELAATSVANALSEGAVTHIGAGAEVRGDVAFLVMLTSRRSALLEPFPREVARGGRATLSGSLVGLKDPRVFVTTPAGKAEEVATRVGARGTFTAQLRFPLAGRYLVEVVGMGDRGPEVAALLPIGCGGATFEETERGEVAEPADAGEAEAQVVAAINAARRRHSLPPLAADPALQAVARRHSADMLARNLLAHVLPGSGNVGERLRVAKVPFRRAAENLAKGPTTLAAHTAAAESPAHLENILSREISRVGCGIARGKLATGDPVIYLTEIFLEPAAGVEDTALTPEGRVKEAIWRARAAARRDPLLADARLDELARGAAAAMLARGQPEATGLRERALALGRGIGAVDTFVASVPSEAERSKNVGDARFKRVGVGVAVGSTPRFGPNRWWIAVVYTD
jgi:uncharacterized protein YkwD